MEDMEASLFTLLIRSEMKLEDSAPWFFFFVVASPADTDPDVRNDLVIQRGPPDVTLRPVLYGAKDFTDVTQSDILVQLDMHRHCRPFKVHNCMVRIGYEVMVPHREQHQSWHALYGQSF